MQLFLLLVLAQSSSSFKAENLSALTKDDFLSLAANPTLNSKYQSEMASHGTISDATLASIKAETAKNDIHLLPVAQPRPRNPRMDLLTAEDMVNVQTDPVLNAKYTADIANYGTLTDKTLDEIFSRRDGKSGTPTSGTPTSGAKKPKTTGTLPSKTPKQPAKNGTTSNNEEKSESPAVSTTGVGETIGSSAEMGASLSFFFNAVLLMVLSLQ
eukprot:NODE_85_length_22318_cov_0.288492.p10 type:complete len:213 gc:universal NODE_85_length_22318_cov_0.288492:715-1353(+)